MTSTIHKVTRLMTRTSSLGSELLLFKHPNAAFTFRPGQLSLVRKSKPLPGVKPTKKPGWMIWGARAFAG